MQPPDHNAALSLRRGSAPNVSGRAEGASLRSPPSGTAVGVHTNSSPRREALSVGWGGGGRDETAERGGDGRRGGAGGGVRGGETSRRQLKEDVWGLNTL